MAYVDGFVLPVPKKKMSVYRRMANTAGKVWREHGALEYRECVGEDLDFKMGTPFAKMAQARPSETVIFAYIVYRNRKHRDQVNAKVMKDKRIRDMMKKGQPQPFDLKRMAYGGFEVFVDA